MEGELPEAYYDIHASLELMWIMTVIRALPAVTTYFCDTFLWYTFFATLFTVFLQWRGRITHAQNWAGGVCRTSTRPTLNRRTSPCVCMIIHPEGKSCGHVRSRFECLFSMTLRLGVPAAHVRDHPRAVLRQAAQPRVAGTHPGNMPATSSTRVFNPRLLS